MTAESVYPIGTRFMSRGKHPRECVVRDILRTYNAAGDLVRVRYVATHELMGQSVADHDVTGVAIGMGLIERAPS